MLILWPRLLEAMFKPQWLKVDFDRIKQDDLETTSDSEIEELAKRNPNSRVYKDRNFGRGRKDRGIQLETCFNLISLFTVQEMKTAYLFLYNLFQFVGFIYLFVIFIIHLFKEGPGSTNSWLFFSLF